MTNRHTPDQTDQTGTADTADTPDPLAALVALDPVAAAATVDTDTGTIPAVTDIVRDVSTADRRALVVAIGTTAPGHAVLIPAVLAAPSGPDPVALVAGAIADRADALVGLILGASERGTLSTGVDAADAAGLAVLAALSRVAPDVAAATVAERPTRSATNRTRNRRNISRDWSGAAGTFHTPGRDGRGPVAVTVRLRSDGSPSFSTVDPSGERRTFSTPTPALAWADGWTADGLKRGWRNPFVALTDRDGSTLGERAPERVESD